MHQPHSSRGFTLIELLVVISIIALLSSVVLASLNAARSKARDSERLADGRQLRNALELYRNDFGSYPSTSGNWRGVCASFGSHGITGAGGYVPNLAPTYIPVLPTDPKPVGTNGCYLYRSDGIDYMVLIYQTVENTPINPALLRPSYTSERNYAFYTDGARTW